MSLNPNTINQSNLMYNGARPKKRTQPAVVAKNCMLEFLFLHFFLNVSFYICHLTRVYTVSLLDTSVGSKNPLVQNLGQIR